MKRLAILSAAFLSAPAYADKDRSWEFDVFLDNKPIGSHTFSISRDGDKTLQQNEAQFDVKVLFVTAFRYRHQNTELWADDCLVNIVAETNSNGKVLRVTGSGNKQGIIVSSEQGEVSLDGCVKTFAYWNPSILDATRLLNSQTGEFEDVRVVSEGEETINVAGETQLVNRYRLSVKSGDILLWYTRDDQRWVGLDAPTKGKRRIRYEASQIPEPSNQTRTLAGAS